MVAEQARIIYAPGTRTGDVRDLALRHNGYFSEPIRERHLQCQIGTVCVQYIGTYQVYNIII